MEFDETWCFCPWNSDQDCTQNHRDRCSVCALERERARSRSKAVLCGDACIHTHEGQLLEFNMGLNGNF